MTKKVIYVEENALSKIVDGEVNILYCKTKESKAYNLGYELVPLGEPSETEKTIQRIDDLIKENSELKQMCIKLNEKAKKSDFFKQVIEQIAKD